MSARRVVWLGSRSRTVESGPARRGIFPAARAIAGGDRAGFAQTFDVLLSSLEVGRTGQVARPPDAEQVRLQLPQVGREIVVPGERRRTPAFNFGVLYRAEQLLVDQGHVVPQIRDLVLRIGITGRSS